jgi:hypothetical protein
LAASLVIRLLYRDGEPLRPERGARTQAIPLPSESLGVISGEGPVEVNPPEALESRQ